tara:strand:- start:1102 stop:1353 length:252 start_codon:yes stop_codon:yes gene_type:complete
MPKRKFESDEYEADKRLKIVSNKRKGLFEYESNKRFKSEKDVYISNLEQIVLQMKQKIEELSYRLKIEQQRSHLNYKNNILVH